MPRLRSIAFALVMLAIAPVAAHAAEGATAPKNVTLVLGDSIAFGYQPATFAAGQPDPDPSAFDTGFADVFIARLNATAPGKLEDLQRRFFPTPVQGLVSLVCLWLLVLLVWKLLDWAVLSAVFSASVGAEACQAAPGACAGPATSPRPFRYSRGAFRRG